MSNRKAPKPANLDRRCSPEAPSTAVSSSNGRFAGRRPAASTSLQKHATAVDAGAVPLVVATRQRPWDADARKAVHRRLARVSLGVAGCCGPLLPWLAALPRSGLLA